MAPRLPKNKASHLLPRSVRHLAPTQTTKGVVFIGDPHVWSHKPGRRLDQNYLKTILGKIIWIAEYCNTHKLYPIILGDLLHDSQDNDLGMISQLIDALQRFDRKPLVLVGNHDISEKNLTPGTVLHLLHTTGQIEAIIHNGPHALLTLTADDGTQEVLIGGTPYGEAIPHSLQKWSGIVGEATHEEIKHAMQVDKVIWITHDDLAFDSSYPNSLALHPILGVDICVNGHMHRTQKPVQKGVTAWYNPGNINRLTIDLIDQIPKIWVYEGDHSVTEPGADGLPVPLVQGVEIPHTPGAEILSLEGRLSTIQSSADLLDEEAPSLPSDGLISKFVEQMKQDEQIARSDDGVFLAGVIQEEFNILKPPASVQDIVSRLFERALLHHRGQQ